ncbi:unnamed protein product [Diamesa tonsa]
MPKKLSTNTKAVEARERKATTKKVQQDAAEKNKEDAKWADDDKTLAKKQEKKLEEERKKAEQLRKKQETKVLLEEEVNSIKVTGKVSAAKITRAQVQDEHEKRNKNIENINNPQKPSSVVTKLAPLEENLNRQMFEVEVAETIEQAIAVLAVKDADEDKHPEKRMKALYRKYEDSQLPNIKAENPSLKLSQLKQIIFKNWQKSPENPLNKM